MLSALEPLGRIGLTAIGATAADAGRQFERARVVLLLAAAARAEAQPLGRAVTTI